MSKSMQRIFSAAEQMVEKINYILSEQWMRSSYIYFDTHHKFVFTFLSHPWQHINILINYLLLWPFKLEWLAFGNIQTIRETFRHNRFHVSSINPCMPKMTAINLFIQTSIKVIFSQFPHILINLANLSRASCVTLIVMRLLLIDFFEKPILFNLACENSHLSILPTALTHSDTCWGCIQVGM